MKLTISETITDIMEVTEQVSVVEIADFDSGVGSVKLGDFNAKGDLLVGTGDGTFTQLEVGDDGKKLTARSTATSGMAWEDETMQEDYITCQGRLTLTTNTPVETGTYTSGTTVYFTPFKGNLVGIYGGSPTVPSWDLYTLTEISIKTQDTQTGNTTNGSAVITGLTNTSQMWVGMEVTGTPFGSTTSILSIDSGSQVTTNTNASSTGAASLTFQAFANIPVDIFISRYNSANKLYGVRWTDANTRATALTRQDGIYVLTGETSWRYVGSVMCSTAGTAYNGVTYRGVYNYYHPQRQRLYARENTAHTYNGAARLWNNSVTDNKVVILNGLTNNVAMGKAEAIIKAGTDGDYAQVQLYLNGSLVETGAVGLNRNEQYVTVRAEAHFYPIAGYNYLNCYESSNHADSSFTGLRLMADVIM